MELQTEQLACNENLIKTEEFKWLALIPLGLKMVQKRLTGTLGFKGNGAYWITKESSGAQKQTGSQTSILGLKCVQ